MQTEFIYLRIFVCLLIYLFTVLFQRLVCPWATLLHYKRFLHLSFNLCPLVLIHKFIKTSKWFCITNCKQGDFELYSYTFFRKISEVRSLQCYGDSWRILSLCVYLHIYIYGYRLVKKWSGYCPLRSPAVWEQGWGASFRPVALPSPISCPWSVETSSTLQLRGPMFQVHVCVYSDLNIKQVSSFVRKQGVLCKSIFSK